MPKPNLSIKIEKDVFFPGETVRGNVLLTLIECLEAKVLLLRFIGKVNWKYADGNDACLGRGNLFNNETILLNHEQQKREADIFLAAGEYVYPFEFILPSDLPSSYQHKYGNKHLETSIYYGVEVVIKRKTLEKDDAFQMEFRIEEVRNLELIPEMKEKLEAMVENNVTFLGMNYGLSIVNMSVPKRGYYLGETMNPVVTIDHSSFTSYTKQLYIEFLRETLHFTANGKEAYRSYLTIKKILLKESLKEHCSYNWTDSISIPIDITPAINIQNCLEVRYSLKLTVELVRGKDITCYLPVVIVQSSGER